MAPPTLTSNGPRQRAGRTKRERSRDKVLAAARSLFVSRGYDASTVAEIADLCGCSAATVYNLFPTKGAIAAAVFWERLQPAIRRAQQAHADPIDGLRGFLKELVEVAHRHYALTAALLQAVQAQSIQSGQELVDNDPRLLAPIPSVAEELIERCQRVGRVRTDVPAAELAAMIVNQALLRVLTRRTASAASTWRLVTTVMLEGISTERSSTELARAPVLT